MKKNRLLKIAAVVFAITILTTCLISGTFAKYTSVIDGAGTVAIATWDVSTAGTGTDNVIAFDALLAPGTESSETVTLKNSSSVSAKATMTVTAKLGGITDETLLAAGNALIAKVIDKTVISGSDTNFSSATIDVNSTVDVVISYFFKAISTEVGKEISDADHTALGEWFAANTSATYTVTVSVTFEQVVA